eukprot:TRINITY_DN1854_c0_g1_i1.p1 TRINITY_DN1854_c0_g1~~TRINITY_DN1854_c0_g1_i1.p1  ORF type:complete len:543 (-),score=142.79 TRINITY_DN1854_c0_g1_i1:124-1752(-)
MATRKLEIVVFYKDNPQTIQLLETANVYDLRQVLFETFKIDPKHQVIDGLGMTNEELSNDIPISILGVEENVIYLSSKEVKSTSAAPSSSSTLAATSDSVTNNVHSDLLGLDSDSHSPSLLGMGNGVNQPHRTENFFQFGPVFSGSTVSLQSPSTASQFFHSPVLLDPNMPINQLNGRLSSLTPPSFSFINFEEYPSALMSFVKDIDTDIEQFEYKFEKTFGETHPIFRGGYLNQLLEVCKIEKSLCIVNLQGSDLETRDFNSLTLSKANLSDYLLKNNIPFWVGEISQQKEKEFIKTYGKRIKFPFLAVLGYSKGRITVIKQISETLVLKQLILLLQDAVSQYQQILIEEEQRELEQQERRDIREEQNMAYQRSVALDLAKHKAQQDEKLLIEQRKSLLIESRLLSIKKKDTLPVEPPKQQQQQQQQKDENGNTIYVILIAIKLPNGSRIDRRFTSDTKLQFVFDFVESIVAERFTDETFLDDKSAQIEDVNNQLIPWSIENYELVCNYPKISFGVNMCDKTLEEVGLKDKQVLLFLQQKS